MRRILKLFFLFLLLSFWGIVLTNQEYFRNGIREITGIGKPCVRPIEYSIGAVDPRFGVSRDVVIEDARQAENLWEKAIDKNLFEYNSEAELKINLIFDSRQQQSDEAENLEKNLEKLDAIRESTLSEYNSLSSDYQERLAEYNKKLTEYEKEIQSFNKDVEYWNGRGGAPSDEYEKLKKRKKRLEEMRSGLEKERTRLNSLINKTNEIAQRENVIVEKYNSGVETYESKFGEFREFEKGAFDGVSINIYEFRENDDLVMTLIHEMGHSLGINHAVNPESIMYYLMGEQDLKNPKLSEEDLSALKNVCRIK